jgi:hypothetical protein
MIELLIILVKNFEAPVLVDQYSTKSHFEHWTLKIAAELVRGSGEIVQLWLEHFEKFEGAGSVEAIVDVLPFLG